MDLLKNRELFLVKKSLHAKVEQLLAACIPHLDIEIRQSGLFSKEDLLKVPPKISRGENYLGFPWQILDYPRLFGKEDVFAVRTLCWWGHGFSLTLHVSGKYASEHLPSLLQHLPELVRSEFYTCQQADQWQHHYDKVNYIPLSELSDVENAVKNHFLQHGFLKFMKKFQFDDWEFFPEKVAENVRLLLNALKKD
ncbi:MAG: hypothetical protein JNL88_05995 [Bacteroidia bacterium]|nr:hypothetical protein [Bacteroidia bacterium]